VDKGYVDINTFLPGDIKIIKVTVAYIFAKFDMADGPTKGLGKVGEERQGWAICNGNNGTDDMNGQIYVGWGEVGDYDDMGASGGSKEHTLTEEQLPEIQPTVDATAGGDTGTGTQRFTTGDSTESGGTFGLQPFGEGEAHNNMQPYKIAVYIQKM